MPYAIDDRANPMFPTIVETDVGESYTEVALHLSRHHLQAAMDHLRAMQRLLEQGGIGTL